MATDFQLIQEPDQLKLAGDHRPGSVLLTFVILALTVGDWLWLSTVEDRSGGSSCGLPVAGGHTYPGACMLPAAA